MELGVQEVGGAVPYARRRTPAPTVSCFLVFPSPDLGLLPCYCFVALLKNHSPCQLLCCCDGAGEWLLEKF